MKPPRVRLLGVPVDCLAMPGARERVREILASDERGGALVLAVNPEKVLTLRHDAELRGLFEGAALLLPDGVGVTLALRLLHGLPCGRVTGVDLLEELLRQAAELDQRVFLLGAREEVNREACAELARRHPTLRLESAHGYLDEEGWRTLPQRIRAARSDLLVVALGSPRQERWMSAHATELNVKLMQGVGGSLDVLAGRVPRAPAWMRRWGLEWLGRLLREPARLRRQWRLPFFLGLALWERLRKGRISGGGTGAMLNALALAILLGTGRAVAQPADPLEPLALRASVEALAGPAAPVVDHFEVGLRAGNRERRLLASAQATLAPSWSLDLLVAGSDREGARELLGSTRTRDRWTGRLLRGSLRHRGRWLELDLGRDRPGAWSREASLALDVEAPPVDQARLALLLPAYGLSLETRAAELPTDRHRSGFRRWLGGHRLSWRRGAFSASVGDLVIYTGWQRRLEPAYLNPFLPAFVANFEGVAEQDSVRRVDNDNNLMTGELRWQAPTAGGVLLLALEGVLDEFQLDENDRDGMRDVYGLRLTAALTRTRPSGQWQAALEGSRLSTWLYQHPGLQTDWAVHGRGLGHPDGGDLLEMKARGAWLAPLSPTSRLGEATGLILELGWQRKGAVELANAWNPTGNADAPVPSSPVRGRGWLDLKGQVEWRPRGHLSVGTFARLQRRFGEAEGWRAQDLELGLCLRWRQ